MQIQRNFFEQKLHKNFIKKIIKKHRKSQAKNLKTKKQKHSKEKKIRIFFKKITR